MRIAMLAPLYESVPPARYGGTERVLYYLIEELVRRGHDVTLFASGETHTSARLEEVCAQPLNRQTCRLADPFGYHLLQLGLAFDRAQEFDLIHSHCDFRAFPFARRSPVPVVSTSHNRLDSPEASALVHAYPDAAVTALSRSQQRQLAGARWIGVCYNGIPVEEFPFSARSGAYLAFVGRLSPEKGPIPAIEIARRSGIPLRIAARINDWERDFFESEIRPRLHPPGIEYVGELDETAKREFLAHALALLFPIAWPEPFGMVTIEAMASGTPVLAFPVGSVPELVENGVTGFIGRDVVDLAAKVPLAAALDRAACRRRAGQRFSSIAMADAYEAAYRRLLAESATKHRRAVGAQAASPRG